MYLAPTPAPSPRTVSLGTSVSTAGSTATRSSRTLTIGPGLGRPLILTTLEDDEAMRVITGGAAGRARLGLACFVAGAVLLALALIWILVETLFLGGAAG